MPPQNDKKNEATISLETRAFKNPVLQQMKTEIH